MDLVLIGNWLTDIRKYIIISLETYKGGLQWDNIKI